MSVVDIAGRRVGAGEPCFLVAELGLNHNGDLDLARRSIDAAAAAGADAVKLQNYRTEDFVPDRSLTYEYVSGGRRVVESQYDLFKRCELAPADLAALKARADEHGLVLFSTPTSPATLADLVALGTPVLKNGSDFLGHLPLIRAMGATGLPTILSTGMATIAEIDEAVRAFRESGNDRLILLHCTSSYPTPPRDVHLRRIPALAAAFGCPVGLSDHTVGIAAAVGAVALGACCIEKHFTLDRDLPGPDHRMSADPAEFRALADGIRAVAACLGDPRIGPTPSEARARAEYRLSCVAARDLPRGHVLAEADVAFLRPGHGVPPAQAGFVIGRRLLGDVPAYHVFAPEDLA
jgi:N,N'-diacetyllegionaminate synthase